MDIADVKHALQRWKNDIEHCLGFPITDIEIQSAYNQYDVYCIEHGFKNLILSELSSSVKDCLTDFICIDLLGIRAVRYGDTKQEKLIFNKKIKEIISLRASILL